ncbi:Predicted metal-dependent hydrolase, TIM-barrel fold [Arboricoccus pini]|uniref:Predicted metal-dependent hydrolase, TIM-barrel fold n=1 Tax=Arboricoccus pini TaxID=1963835 RepID=A0A212RYK5_9PROT|nr:amidohydrolase family protein [Arboricoccus pini]SNB77886.1 Predicted metal-dependent hydrolase, TIM-barrel fold [Arboricoccus pini]
MTLYDGPILDAHHHLWDLGMRCHPWLASEAGDRGGLDGLEKLKRSYLVEDYRQDAARQNVVATVHIEAMWRPDEPGGETAWLDRLDKRQGVASRYVAGVALGEQGAAAQLEAEAAHPRVVSIRDILSWDPDPSRSFARRGDLMSDPAWRSDLGRLAGLGLVFDMMVFAQQLPDAARLAADFPQQTFVLNHCGSPIDRSAEGMKAWRDGLRLLGRLENVHIKMSDLVGYDHDWTLSSLRDVALHCIDCFGPKRALFASDFPVAGLHATFDQVYDSFKEIVRDFTPAEQRALFYDNGRKLYGLNELAA